MFARWSNSRTPAPSNTAARSMWISSSSPASRHCWIVWAPCTAHGLRAGGRSRSSNGAFDAVGDELDRRAGPWPAVGHVVGDDERGQSHGCWPPQPSATSNVRRPVSTVDPISHPMTSTLQCPGRAVLTGRRTFEVADGWGGQHPWDVPVFVAAHGVPDGWPRPGSTVQFVTDGIESAVARAKSAADPKSVEFTAPKRSSSAWTPGCSTRSTSIWLPWCSAQESGYSTTSRTHRSSSGIRQSSPVWASRICAIPCTRRRPGG